MNVAAGASVLVGLMAVASHSPEAAAVVGFALFLLWRRG